MWYVIQTQSGKEDELKQMIEGLLEDDVDCRSFIPLYEEVRRRAGRNHILFRRMFPGYLFVETGQPEELFRIIRKIPRFKRLLGSEDDDKGRIFTPVGKDDEAFLRTLTEDGVMHVSFVRLAKNGRKIEQIAGPLAPWRNHITSLQLRHREAVVEAEMFGKKRRIRFGLWTDGDPRIPWLEKQMNQEQPQALDEGSAIDIGLHPGDHIIDETGLYGTDELVVEEVDAGHRTVYTRVQLFNTRIRIGLDADSVRKV